MWSAPNPDLQLLTFDRFQPLLGSRKQQWGTTTEFVAWKGDRVLVRIFDYVDSNAGAFQHRNEVIVSYDIRTEKIALEQ